jgi:hypothetical protein
MDCSVYVLTSPLVLIISMLVGFTFSNYKNKQELEELYDDNDKLNLLLDEKDEEIQELLKSINKSD